MESGKSDRLAILNQLVNVDYFQKANNFDFQWHQPQSHSQNVKLEITQKKPFKYDEQKGQIWYKNLNIPEIFVELFIDEEKDNEKDNFREQNPFNSIISCFCCNQSIQQFHQIHLEGAIKQNFKDKKCSFKNLKFTSTTHLQKGSKFYLIVSLSKYLSKSSNEIVNSNIFSFNQPVQLIKELHYVSSPLVILSRKDHSFEPSSGVFVEFLPKFLDQQLVKVTNSKNTKIKIEDSIDGLFHYLTMPRNRSKIFHPIFLFLRFPSAVKLMYHKDMCNCHQDDPQFFSHLQQEILRSQASNDEQNYNFEVFQHKEIVEIPKEKLIQFSLIYPSHIKQHLIQTIYKYLNQIEGPTLNIIKNNNYSHLHNYIEIVFKAKLIQNYKSNYYCMTNLKFQLGSATLSSVNQNQSTLLINSIDKSKNKSFEDDNSSSKKNQLIKVFDISREQGSLLEPVKCLKYQEQYTNKDDNVFISKSDNTQVIINNNKMEEQDQEEVYDYNAELQNQQMKQLIQMYQMNQRNNMYANPVNLQNRTFNNF